MITHKEASDSSEKIYERSIGNIFCDISIVLP